MAIRKKTAAAKKPGYCMYLGPTIRGVIQNGQVFPGGVNEALSTLPEKHRTTEVRGLLVAAEDLPDAMKRLRSGGSSLIKQYYKRLAERGL